MRTAALVMIMALVAPSAWAQEAPAVDAVLAKMNEAYKGTTALQASFVQTSAGMSFFEPLIQSGTVTLEAPGRMRWDFESPRKQSYLSDGRTLWMVDEGDKTCTVFRSVDGMLQRFYGFLTGTADLRADFRVSVVDEPDTPVPGAVILKLSPLQPDGSIDTLRVYVDGKSHRVIGVTMITPFGDRTDTVLRDVRLLDDVPDERFVWTARPGFREIAGD